MGLAGVSQFNHQKIHLDRIEKAMSLYKKYTITPYLALAAVFVSYMSLIWAYNTYDPNLTFLELSKSLQDSELAYRTIFENTGNSTVIIDEEGIISLANTEFERLSGYTKK